MHLQLKHSYYTHTIGASGRPRVPVKSDKPLIIELHRVMEASKISNMQVAYMLDVSRACVCYWFQGHSYPSGDDPETGLGAMEIKMHTIIAVLNEGLKQGTFPEASFFGTSLQEWEILAYQVKLDNFELSKSVDNFIERLRALKNIKK